MNAIRDFMPAPLLAWVVYRWDGERGGPMEWQAIPVFGWTRDGFAVISDGEQLEAISPRAKDVWAIVMDATADSTHAPARRAIAYAKSGSYALPDDPAETVPFGAIESEAA